MTTRPPSRPPHRAMGTLVVVEHDPAGRVHLRQALNLTTTGAVGGGFWGTLVGDRIRP